MADIQITGLAELHKALQELPANIERNVLRGGLRAGANVIRQEAVRLAPEAPPTLVGVKLGARIGELKRSIRVSMRVRSKAGWVNARVVAGNVKAWYAHLVEFGTARHWIRPKHRKSLFIAGAFAEAIAHPGAKPKPFMRPAWDGQHQQALEVMADYIRQRLPKEFKKAGK